ncbi:MAG: hypothetical protein RLZZ126_1145 [Pseudomonadota bacterium]
MQIHLIWAQARNRVIGKDGGMPWHLPEDLAHFKTLTAGCPVIMGRRTWDSLPPRFKPLPGRRNIVLTRSTDWRPEGEESGVQVVQDVHDALLMCEHAPTAWIIGGAQVYAQALPWAHEAEVTEIETDADGDAHAPILESNWIEAARSHHRSASGMPYSFVTYLNTAPQDWRPSH